MYRNDFCAHQLHAKHIGGLTLNILGPHIHTALEPQKGTGQRGGHTMLTGTGFGNNFFFAHTLGQQRLTQYLIGFVSAAMQQIFPLQVNFGQWVGA